MRKSGRVRLCRVFAGFYDSAAFKRITQGQNKGTPQVFREALLLLCRAVIRCESDVQNRKMYQRVSPKSVLSGSVGSLLVVKKKPPTTTQLGPAGLPAQKAFIYSSASLSLLRKVTAVGELCHFCAVCWTCDLLLFKVTYNCIIYGDIWVFYSCFFCPPAWDTWSWNHQVLLRSGGSAHQKQMVHSLGLTCGCTLI